jgi:hypothetical protein
MEQAETPFSTVTEAVGVFSSEKELETAADELMSHGFDRADISLLASEEAVIEKLGHRYRSVRDIEDNPKIPTTAFLTEEGLGAAEGGVIGGLVYLPALAGVAVVVASGGTMAAAIAAAAILGGVGGGIGGVLARIIGQDHADRIEEQIEHGGLLLFVRTSSPEAEQTATDILTRNHARDVHLHAIPSFAGR